MKGGGGWLCCGGNEDVEPQNVGEGGVGRCVSVLVLWRLKRAREFEIGETESLPHRSSFHRKVSRSFGRAARRLRTRDSSLVELVESGTCVHDGSRYQRA
ncbi:unnamed protein product [Macrosiphum euphorbiae]|uniref:Uncharacterized protein n=1 Tax=Macrosiphum euphorbiae TaxID=13131 RepID=A0AAV0WHJ7_9HEMI|nr:unnamed protein product [Macrosiphum euphorbiae]